MIGIDVIEVERIERALERSPRLAERLFSEGERAYAEGRARPARHLAARFAAKEAVTKALELPGLRPREVEVIAGEGAPRVRLAGRAAERARELGAEVRVSLTHARELAAAVAVLER